MKRILALVCCLLAMNAFAANTCSTCYIAANGNDSWDGAAKVFISGTTGPWLHAPGMPAATGNAATQVPVAGDKYIFRGGDSWHFGNSGATPYTGGTWLWNWNGSTINPMKQKLPTVAVNSGSGTAWTNPTAVTAYSTSTYAQATITSGSTQNLDITGYGFTLPSNATVNWIDIQLHGWAGATGTVNTSGSTITWASGADFTGMQAGALIQLNGGSTYIVQTVNSSTSLTTTTAIGTLTGATFLAMNGSMTFQILKGGVPTGNVLTFTHPVISQGNVVFGRDITTWGATLAYSDVNASNFGIRLIGTGNSTFNWNYVAMAVRYSIPGSADCDTSDDPAANRSSCIYIGTDPTYYSGGSFARPIMTGDNPTSTTAVSSCAYPNVGAKNRFLQTQNTNFAWFDNLEWTGLCEQTLQVIGQNYFAIDAYIFDGGASAGITQNIFSRMYPHGVTHLPWTTAPVSITSWSITSNVATFQGANSYSAGDNIVLTGFTGGAAFFNNTIGEHPVLASGLTNSQFSISFTHANGSGSDTGTATGFTCNTSGGNHGYCYGAGFLYPGYMSTVEKNFVDGSDSDPMSFMAMFAGGYLVYDNYFGHQSQVVTNGCHVWHDNIWQNYYGTGDGEAHGNSHECNVTSPQTDANGFMMPGTPANAFYNNIFGHNDPTAGGAVKTWFQSNSKASENIFNNKWYDQSPGNNLDIAVNDGFDSAGGLGMPVNLFQNTLSLPTATGVGVNNPLNLNAINNFFIIEPSLGNGFFSGQGTITNSTIITHAQAVTQGYMANGTGTNGYDSNVTCANDTTPCAPVLNTNSSVNAGSAGQAAVASICTSLLASADKMIQRAGAACQNGTTDGIALNFTNHTISYPLQTAVSRPFSASQDNGADQFSGATYSLNIVSANGTVVDGGAIFNCHDNFGTCSVSGLSGPISLTATPDTGYSFSGWDNAGPCNGQGNPCSFVLSSNSSVTANYAAIPPTGTLSCVNGCSVNLGSAITLSSTIANSTRWNITGPSSFDIACASNCNGTFNGSSSPSLTFTPKLPGIYTLTLQPGNIASSVTIYLGAATKGGSAGFVQGL